jgi:class 3 adenylate cyclase
LSTVNWRQLARLFLLVGGAWLAAHGCFWLQPQVFNAWNAQTVDQLFVLRNALEHLRPPYDARVMHVDFNNSSITRLKRARQTIYLTRTHHAQLVRNLAAMRVAAQAHDFIFVDRLPDATGRGMSRAGPDQELIAATAAADAVYYGLSLRLESGPPTSRPSPERAEEQHYLEQTAWRVVVEGDASAMYTGADPRATFAALAAASRGLGYLSVVADRDGVYRRLPLLARYGTAFYPSFAFRVACDYLRVPPENILVRPGKHIVLRQAHPPGAPVPHDIVIPIDRQGNMVINFLGAWERLAHLSLADVLLASEDRDELDILGEKMAGNIVVVADIVFAGSSDVGAVPLDANFPLSGLHSNVINTIITERFLRELSPLEMLGIEALVWVILLGLAWGIASRWIVLGTGLIGMGYLGFGIGSFLYAHLICNLLRPLLMVAFTTVALVVYRYVEAERAKLEGLRQRDFVRNVFGRYLSNAVVEEILGSPHGLDMGGEVRQITLLVSDLRGFTSLSARLSAREVIAILNGYFERMIAVIGHYRGTVDELMGDGMLVFFGAPLAAPDDPPRAVACALAMQRALVEVNAELSAQHLPQLAMGIGINTGEVVVGNIGSTQRSKYGAVGSAINAAYRIESYTIGGQVFISPSTYTRVQSLVHVRGTIQAQFKGLDQPVTLYDIAGIAGPYGVTLPDKPVETWVTLTSPIPVECFAVEDKVVATGAIAGQITRLAGSTAEGTLAEHLPLYTNVKLVLTPRGRPQLADVYAKVLALAPSATGATSVRLEFTSVPEEARAFLSSMEQTASTA